MKRRKKHISKLLGNFKNMHMGQRQLVKIPSPTLAYVPVLGAQLQFAVDADPGDSGYSSWNGVAATHMAAG